MLTERKEDSMKRKELRQKLIDGTIQVIAQDGLDKATTKQVGIKTNTNEVYIYRCFKSKEDMFTKTFDSLDEELINAIMQSIDVMSVTALDFEVRSRVFFYKIWDFLLTSREKCLTYIRYYYSPYFKNYSMVTHKQRFAPVIEAFRVRFIEEADVWMILNHILNVMLDFAIKVHNGQATATDNFSEHVFRVVYRSIDQYFKKEEVSNK